MAELRDAIGRLMCVPACGEASGKPLPVVAGLNLLGALMAAEYDLEKHDAECAALAGELIAASTERHERVAEALIVEARAHELAVQLEHLGRLRPGLAAKLDAARRAVERARRAAAQAALDRAHVDVAAAAQALLVALDRARAAEDWARQVGVVGEATHYPVEFNAWRVQEWIAAAGRDAAAQGGAKEPP